MKEKEFFLRRKLETLFGTIVWHGNMHIYANYDHIIMKFAMGMAITLVIWFENHSCLYMHDIPFCEGFLLIMSNIYVYHYS